MKETGGARGAVEAGVEGAAGAASSAAILFKVGSMVWCVMEQQQRWEAQQWCGLMSLESVWNPKLPLLMPFECLQASCFCNPPCFFFVANTSFFLFALEGGVFFPAPLISPSVLL